MLSFQNDVKKSGVGSNQNRSVVKEQTVAFASRIISRPIGVKNALTKI